MYHNIYVEGAGAYDVANGSTSNINGLGFGLGKTGVTALVSKAIKEIYAGAQIVIYETRGLCSYYAEKGGVLLACECEKAFC